MAACARVTIRGRVQGVGFRYAAYREATALGLTGWVRNAYDGNVEAEFVGAEDAVQRMVDWCREGPPYAHVHDVAVEWLDHAQAYACFDIRT